MSINNIGCILAGGYRLDECKNATGIKNLYFTNFSNYNYQGDTLDSNDRIIFLNMINLTEWYKFEMVQENTEWREEKVEDDRTGLIFYNQELKFQLHNISAILRKQVLQLLYSKPYCIFETIDNRCFLLGRENGLSVDMEDIVEKSMGGFDGWNITLKGAEKYPAYEVIGSAITVSTTYVVRDNLNTSEPVPADQA